MRMARLERCLLVSMVLCVSACNPISTDPRVGQWVLEQPMDIPALDMEEAHLYVNISWQNYGSHTQTYVIEETVRVPARSEQADTAWQEESRLITAKDANGHERRWWEFGQTDYMLQGDDEGLCESAQQCPLRLSNDKRYLKGSLKFFRQRVNVTLKKIDPLKRQSVKAW